METIDAFKKENKRLRDTINDLIDKINIELEKNKNLYKKIEELEAEILKN